jgi:hypothetical protein
VPDGSTAGHGLPGRTRRGTHPRVTTNPSRGSYVTHGNGSRPCEELLILSASSCVAAAQMHRRTCRTTRAATVPVGGALLSCGNETSVLYLAEQFVSIRLAHKSQIVEMLSRGVLTHVQHLCNR